MMLQDRIQVRVLDVARYMIKHNSTVRDTARVFGVSKSTVHKDVTKRILTYNSKLAHDVRKVLDKNLAERHIRGGFATKKMLQKRSK